MNSQEFAELFNQIQNITYISYTFIHFKQNTYRPLTNYFNLFIVLASPALKHMFSDNSLKSKFFLYMFFVCVYFAVLWIFVGTLKKFEVFTELQYSV